jgi:hypothetical protein
MAKPNHHTHTHTDCKTRSEYSLTVALLPSDTARDRDRERSIGKILLLTSSFDFLFSKSHQIDSFSTHAR